MNSTILTYLIYAIIAFATILKVGHVLYNTGKVYLSVLFPEDLSFVHNVNRILLIAYYLLNLGYVLIQLKIGVQIDSYTQIISILSIKLSIIILIIAGVHYINLTWMYLLARTIDKKHHSRNTRL